MELKILKQEETPENVIEHSKAVCKKAMKILNVIWGFSTGGIGKCYLTYNRLGEVDKNIYVDSVCIDIKNKNYDRKALYENNISIISKLC